MRTSHPQRPFAIAMLSAMCLCYGTAARSSDAESLIVLCRQAKLKKPDAWTQERLELVITSYAKYVFMLRRSARVLCVDDTPGWASTLVAEHNKYLTKVGDLNDLGQALKYRKTLVALTSGSVVAAIDKNLSWHPDHRNFPPDIIKRTGIDNSSDKLDKFLKGESDRYEGYDARPVHWEHPPAKPEAIDLNVSPFPTPPLQGSPFQVPPSQVPPIVEPIFQR